MIVLSIYILYNEIGSRKYLRYVLVTILIACSLGSYQAYIGIYTTLVCMLTIIDIMYNKINIKIIFYKITVFISCLIFGGIIYYVVLKLHLNYHKLSLSDYKGLTRFPKYLKILLDY